MMYFPNIAELESLKCLLTSQAWRLGLYKNVLSPDGSMSMLQIQEMPAGGGRGYATKDLVNAIAEALTADKWYLSLNAAGKAEARYHNDWIIWTFNATDVGDGNTVFGAFAYVYVVPFDGGVGEIKVGDTVTGATSGATGVVTAVHLISGTWGGSDAAGYLVIKDKSATAFQNDEDLNVSAVKKAVSNTGTLYAGDAHKQLLFVDEFSEPKPITVSGQQVKYVPKFSQSTG